MEIFEYPERERWGALCRRNFREEESIDGKVIEIINKVVSEGDAALRELAMKYDGVELDSLRMSEQEIEAAVACVDPKVADAISRAAGNIEKFHAAQLMAHPVDVEVTTGVRCIQRQVPINTVGLYIPGGRAPLFSTVLMLAIPARIAGCPRRILCTPFTAGRGIAPEIVYAAKVCGIDEIYKVGGAQAIAAMAKGTESIPRVDKIFGPGNRFVTCAKQMVAGIVAIDMPAGPSEVMVMADETALPRYVAADLLSQAEHGPDSQAILVTDSADMARRVADEVKTLTAHLSRRESVAGSLSQSRLIVLRSRGDMIDFANKYASEHLIISMSEPWDVADKITSAGSVFIGNYSPESAGDYASGTNHTLPTSGWAASYSGVNIDSFMKKITYQELTRDGLRSLSEVIVTMADAEGLDAHALAVKVRLEK
ncbi:MAG: histidinol dehydrogenase [Paramuribaculum sp.]|nr:histidinol dehydrogenase [Paramuribaculum sp.]